MNPISQEAEPQPSPSSSLNRCLQLYWVKGITDADCFMHRGEWKPSKYFNSCSLYEGKHELKQFCWMQLWVPSKERQHSSRPVQSPKTLGYCSQVVTTSAQRNTTGKSNTGLHRHSTYSARASPGIHHKLLSAKAAVLTPAHTANASHPKAAAVGPLCHSGSQPDLHPGISLCCKTPETDPCHTTLASHEQDEVICLLGISVKSASSVPKLHCCVCEPVLLHSATVASTPHPHQNCTAARPNPHHPFPDIPVLQSSPGIMA